MKAYEDFAREIISKLPKITIDMRFEVLSSIYPDSKIPSKIKNINEEFTKPLALSAKDKMKIRKKRHDILEDFLNYKKTKKEKGDILKVIKIENNRFMCENISRPQEITEKYYNNEEIKYISISYRDILEGNIKQIQRVRK
jgi:hypothetical protein